MLQNSGPVALSVLVVLAIASIYSWTLIFSKMSSFAKATKQSRRFVKTFRKATRLQEIAAVTGDYQPSPLALVFDEVYEAYKRQTGGYGPPRNVAPLERSAQTASSEALTRLEQRLTWLATIASTSTFVGLFGTVMGIVDAFHGLGTAGSATLRAVAPGISEALIHRCGHLRRCARGCRLQPVHRQATGIRFGNRRFCPRVAELSRRNSAKIRIPGSGASPTGDEFHGQRGLAWPLPAATDAHRLRWPRSTSRHSSMWCWCSS
jgi:biopolymer transport protein ExbB/TolQ